MYVIWFKFDKSKKRMKQYNCQHIDTLYFSSDISRSEKQINTSGKYDTDI